MDALVNLLNCWWLEQAVHLVLLRIKEHHPHPDITLLWLTSALLPGNQAFHRILRLHHPKARWGGQFLHLHSTQAAPTLHLSS
ncbi:unnamed protein product [Arctogadus glacialis]